MNVKSIYCITNLINGKQYIGQSIHPYLRFKEHCQKSIQCRSLIHDAIQKHGKENFTLEILEENIENYNEREQYWIDKKQTLTPNGYNILKGGEYEFNHKIGEESILSLYSDKQFQQIIYLLQKTNLTSEEIASQVNCSNVYVHSVNLGTARSSQKEDNVSYPIKNWYTKIDENNLVLIIEDLYEQKLTQKEIAQKYNISTAMVSGINTGRLHKQNNYKYPIRNKRIKHRWGYYSN